MKAISKILTAALLFVLVFVGTVFVGTSLLPTVNKIDTAVVTTDKYSEWMKSMVRIMIVLPDGERIIAGSGWILTKDGVIVTNCHVIREAMQGSIKEIRVVFYDGTYTTAVKVLGGDPEGDVGLLGVTVKKELREMPLRDSSTVKMGEDVFLLGNPLNEGLIVTHGIVANPFVTMQEFPFAYIETDGTINPGNSGGAMVDSNGNLIAMPSLLGPGRNGGNGYGFGIISNDIAWSILMIAKHVPLDRASLGIKIKPYVITNKDTGIISDAGALVDDSISPLLIKGDIIIAINDTKVTTSGALHYVLGKILLGDHFTLTVLRNNATVVIPMIAAPLKFPEIKILPLESFKDKDKDKDHKDYRHHRRYHRLHKHYR